MTNRTIDARDRLILALDVKDIPQARQMVAALEGMGRILQSRADPAMGGGRRRFHALAACGR